MATRQARATAASARSGGYKPSGIGAKARAAALKLRSAGTAAASTISQHLSPDQFGRHARAVPARNAAMSNARGGTAYEGRHRSGNLAAGEPGEHDYRA